MKINLTMILLYLFLISIISCSTDTQEVGVHEPLFPIMVDDKWGFMNAAGEVIIEPQYEVAYNYNDSLDLALVKKNDKFGYINRDNKTKIKFNYDALGIFIDGYTLANKGDKWGVINTSGKNIIKIKYDYCTGVINGRARVNIGGLPVKYSYPSGGKWGFVNASGKNIIECKYDYVHSFHDSITAFCEGCEIDSTGAVNWYICEECKWGLIDKTGKIVAAPTYDFIADFHEGLAAVKLNNKWGYINITAELVIDTLFDKTEAFYEGLAPVLLQGDSCWSYINKNGEVMFTLDCTRSFEWLIPGHFSEELLAYRDTETLDMGFVNKNGEIVIKPIYDWVGNFKHGIAWVQINDSEAKVLSVGYIDKHGNYVWKNDQDDLFQSMEEYR
jgi:WG containing repeat